VNIFQKLGLMVKERSVRFPTMPHVPKLPRISFGNAAASKAVVFSVVLATAVVATGIFFAVKDVAVASWDWPEAGAEYNLPHKMGEKLPPYEDGSESQTLKINLAAGVRLSALTLNNLDIGRASTPCVTIERATGTSGWLFVDTWSITGATAKAADFANMEVNNLVLQAYTDGHTMEATIDSTISDIDAQSTRSSGVYNVQDSVVDQIVLVLLGDATISQMTFTDVDCSDGTGWNIDYVKAGAVTIDATSKWGSGNGINSADFVVNSTVKAHSITDQLVDTPITVR
jgi:hypothetical protein